MSHEILPAKLYELVLTDKTEVQPISHGQETVIFLMNSDVVPAGSRRCVYVPYHRRLSDPARRRQYRAGLQQCGL